MKDLDKAERDLHSLKKEMSFLERKLKDALAFIERVLRPSEK